MGVISSEIIGYTPPEVQTPAVTTEVILKQGEPVLLSEPRLDNVGTPDFTALAAEAKLRNDFTAYQKEGGEFSLGLYKTLMDGVAELQKPGEREKSKFSTGTEWQIIGWERNHNKPFLKEKLPPEQQIFLTEAQKDAYRVFRSRLVIPDEDRQKHAYLSDALLFEDILKMPSLKSQEEQLRQEQPLALPAAA